MKRLFFLIAIAAVVSMANQAQAENPEQGAKQKRSKPSQLEGRSPRDPGKLVARIMTEFDKDGDQKLDRTELTAWLKSMRERRGQSLRKRGAGKPNGPGKPRGLRGDVQGRPGGEVPNRPESE